LTTTAAATLTTANGPVVLRSGISEDGSIISTVDGDIAVTGAVSMGATGAQPIDWRASGDLKVATALSTAQTDGQSIMLLAAQGVNGTLGINGGLTTSNAPITLYAAQIFRLSWDVSIFTMERTSMQEPQMLRLPIPAKGLLQEAAGITRVVYW